MPSPSDRARPRAAAPAGPTPLFSRSSFFRRQSGPRPAASAATPSSLRPALPRHNAVRALFCRRASPICRTSSSCSACPLAYSSVRCVLPGSAAASLATSWPGSLRLLRKVYKPFSHIRICEQERFQGHSLGSVSMLPLTSRPTSGPNCFPWKMCSEMSAGSLSSTRFMESARLFELPQAIGASFWPLAGCLVCVAAIRLSLRPKPR